MYISPKYIRQGVVASFMALAASHVCAELPVNAVGKVDWLPISGPVEDKVCPSGKRPGSWFVAFSESFAKQDIVFVTTNSCKERFMKLNPANGQVVSVLSNSEVMGSQPAKVLNAVSAPDRWWERSDLLPLKPQGEPVISGPGPTGGMCQITFGNSQTLKTAPGALVIPDASRAYYIYTRNDPSIKSEKINETTTVDYGSKGKSLCAIRPVIVMPAMETVASRGGGRWGSIGNIDKSPNPNVEPAFFFLAIPVIMGIEELSLLALSGATAITVGNWLKDHPAVLASNTIVIPRGGDLIDGIVEMSSLSPVEIGRFLNVKNQSLDCKEEIRRATEICNDFMSKPNPPLGVIGKETREIEQCIKGLISERCGGNRMTP